MQENNEFFIPKPKLLDFSTWSILIPVLASAIGLFLMSVEAMVFVQFDSLPVELRKVVSIASAFFMAFGGEVGTVSNTVEIFRKYIRSTISVKFEWDVITTWDYVGLVVSALATLLAMVIASSTREVQVNWATWVSGNLIIALMIVSVGDVYAGMMELGLRLGTFELRMQDWIVREEEDRQQKLYQKKLEESNKRTRVFEQQVEKLKCWCGATLNSFDDYNNHLNIHKAQARKLSNAEKAFEHFNNISISGADFAIPDVNEISEW